MRRKAPDVSSDPTAMSEQQKVDYYKSLLANAPNAKVVSLFRFRRHGIL